MNSIERLTGPARRILDEAASRDIPVRLLGGVAIWMRVSSATRARFEREYADLDFVAHSSRRSALSTLLVEQGFVGEKRFNAIHGERRLIFYPADNSYHVDIFLDQFEMSHKIDFRRRLEVEEDTVPGAELLLTKLQIAQINRKDLSDILMLLSDHALAEGDGPRRLSVSQIVALCASDWGLYTTVSDNIAMARTVLPQLVQDMSTCDVIGGRLDDLEERLRHSPKSLGWKMRARVGRRVQWFEVPEEVRP
jgi:hypothetical protein